MNKLFFDWGISDHSGWGVYGSNLLMFGIKDSRYDIYPLDWPPSFIYPPNPIAALEIDKYFSQKKTDSTIVSKGDILLTALGNAVEKKDREGILKEIGIIFFEANPLKEINLTNLRKFSSIITGSTWNQQQLEAHGIQNELVIQGIDTDLFRPLPKKYLKDRFVVFSGGKLEFRKGQDIALKAFAIFAEKHPEALLISCWRSPWEEKSALTINRSQICDPLVPQKDMGVAIRNWVLSNGVKPSQYSDLGSVSNQLMPEIFREVDIAIFPNRAEGGTNLVAMEAISAGLNCAISRNTGHLDLIEKSQCTSLTTQSAVTIDSSTPCTGWGESSIDELVAALESAYQNQSTTNDKLKISNSIKDYSWENSISKLLNIISTI
jgi:glycosyltransferase involved in cell wall biosynthesis